MEIWQEEEALKRAPVIPDENQMNFLNLSEAVMKPVTFMMSLLPGMMMNSNALTEKWKCCDQIPSSVMTSDCAFVYLLEYEEQHSTKKMPKASCSKSWRDLGEDNICWKVNWFVFKLKQFCGGKSFLDSGLFCRSRILRRNGTARDNPHLQFAAGPNFFPTFSCHVGLTTCLGPVHLVF